MTHSDARNTGVPVTIERLGSKGDGQARVGENWVSVPLALPGEEVRIERDGESGKVLEVLRASPDRAEAPCRHFDSCGACCLQHFSGSTYRHFKRDMIVQALKAQGLETQVEDPWLTPPGSRRRIMLAAQMSKEGLHLGYDARRSDQIVDIEECAVASPEIVRKLGALREIAAPLAPLKGEMSLMVTAAPNGLDLHMTGVATFAAPHDLKMAAAKALAAGFVRVSIGHEVPLSQEEPAFQVGKAFLRPPPGSELIASAEAETFMASLVRQHLKFAIDVVNLFSGSGAFALRLAEEARVLAVDSDAYVLNALEDSAADAPGLKPVTVEMRDLLRDPVPAATLSKYGGLLIDPPLSGARLQMAEVAMSGVRRVAYLSHDPMQLARDMRTLADAGYRLNQVYPVDVLRWSSHVESVALLERGG